MKPFRLAIYQNITLLHSEFVPRSTRRRVSSTLRLLVSADNVTRVCAAINKKWHHPTFNQTLADFRVPSLPPTVAIGQLPTLCRYRWPCTISFLSRFLNEKASKCRGRAPRPMHGSGKLDLSWRANDGQAVSLPEISMRAATRTPYYHAYRRLTSKQRVGKLCRHRGAAGSAAYRETMACWLHQWSMLSSRTPVTPRKDRPPWCPF